MEQELKEKQSKRCVELAESCGLTTLGLHSNQWWCDDPKRLAFVLARYKFVSKLLRGYERVLEIGCGDAFGSRLVQAEVESFTAVDFEPVFVKDIKARMADDWHFDCRLHDITSGPVPEQFDAAYSLDVVEHIPVEDEHRFMQNICDSLKHDSVLIIGTPSLQSQTYASEMSKQGHVNCKTGESLQELVQGYFRHVFIFSMNDEVVHTGFYPMAQYLFAVCCTRKPLKEKPE
jgi:SAM-dependent methyltransferase